MSRERDVSWPYMNKLNIGHFADRSLGGMANSPLILPLAITESFIYNYKAKIATTTTIISNNKWPHPRRTRTVQSYSPAGANVPPCNTMLLSAHPSPKPKQHLDRFSRFLHSSRRSVLEHVGACPSPKNCPFPWGT